MSDLGNKNVMAKNIKYFMNLARKDRADVCRDLGLKKNTFADWVRGAKYPRINKIEQLADYFGINKSDLFVV